MKLNKIEIENNLLNNEYENSYKINYNLLTTNDYKYLIDYRNCIFNKILENNQIIKELNINLVKQCNIYKYLINVYNNL